jgi:hypothetical protein
MLASALILVFSCVLLVYWFRYSCLLLLRQRAGGANADPRFGISRIQEGLLHDGPLDPLHQALNRDYQLLTYLLDHASGISLESIEDRLLVLDYSIMRFWYRVTRSVFPSHARRALAEMASVLSVLAQRMGEQTGAYTGA